MGAKVIILKKNIVFLSLKFDLDLANSADPDKLPHIEAFCLGLN